MNVPVTHYLETGYDASEVHPGVYILDGLGAVLAESLAAQNVRFVAIGSTDSFDVTDVVLADAQALFDGIERRRNLGL